MANIPEPELSGEQWVGRFLGSTSIADLDDDFGANVQRFVDALKSAKASVSIAATYRPPERAYLMHWCWMLNNDKVKHDAIPAKEGVNIKWDHPTKEASKSAASEMVAGFSMGSLKVAPALNSRHTTKQAIDMTIGWKGNLTITNASGEAVIVETEPRTGMNEILQTVGATYGVAKFTGGNKDKPHWSTDGK